MKLSNKNKGILFIILAAFGFSLMSACVRLSGDLPSIQKAFFRNAVALVFITGIMLKQKISFVPKKENLLFLLLRSSTGLIGMICNFYAIDRLLLADANMLNKLSPFFAILFSIFLLKELPNIVQILGLIVAFVGSVLIIKPSFNNPDVIPAIVAVMGALGSGFAYTCVRKLGQKGENGSRVIFFFSLFSTLVCLPFMLSGIGDITLKQYACLVLAGCGGCLGQIGLTKAYFYAPAKEISVYDYSQVIFAAIFGFFLFSQTPDIYSVLGYILICGAGIAMFVYNNRKKAK